MFYIIAVFVLLLKNEISVVSGANILGLMGIPSPSHHVWNSVLMHRLGELGHNVTVLSPDIPKPNEKLPKNVHYIHLEEGYSFYKGDDKLDLKTFVGIGTFEAIPMFYDFGLIAGTVMLKSKGLQTLLNYPDDFKFDLVVYDYTMGPHLLGFIHKFNYPPLVGISAFHNPPNTMDAMSNHYFPAYVPYHSMVYTSEMNFWQRLENTLVFIYDTANSVLMHRLGELGHNVTVLSPDIPKPNEKLQKNVHYIHLEEGYSFYKVDDVIDVKTFAAVGPFGAVPMFYESGLIVGALLLKSKGLQTLLNYPDNFKFDLVVYDYTMGPNLLGFIHKFNYPPLVGISAFHNPPNTMDAMSNHYFPAYVPYHSMVYTSEMNFWQRLENTLVFIYDTAYRRLIYKPKLDAMVRAYFPKDMPYLGDLEKHTAISLVNSHPATNYVEALPQNVIEVGGMQIVDPKPLPEDLDEFMNKTKNGVIFISFGTNMKSEDFSKEQVHVIVSAMAQLPEYNFMWKFDVKYLKEELPPNVLVRSFFPQRDILAHPNIKAFVTHCGGLSTQEATWRGVPMIGVPVFMDQHRNLRQALQSGTAVKLDFVTLTTDNLRDAIKHVAEDPQIRANVKAKAVQYKDRPAKALDTAVWWVEYLLRNPNPYHLKSAAEKLNIFQANSLDCLLFILVVFGIVNYLKFKLLSLAWRIIKGNKVSNSKKLKSN